MVYVIILAFHKQALKSYCVVEVYIILQLKMTRDTVEEKVTRY